MVLSWNIKPAQLFSIPVFVYNVGTTSCTHPERGGQVCEGQGKLIALPCWGWLPLQEGCVMDDAEALGLTGNNSLPRGMRPLTGLRQPGRNNSSHSTAPQLPHNPPLQVHLQLSPTLLLRVTTINMKYEGPL